MHICFSLEGAWGGSVSSRVSPALSYGPWSGPALQLLEGRPSGACSLGATGFLDSDPWCTGPPVTGEALVTL